MKIQIFVQSLSVGGAERVAAMWANEFARQNHNVEIVLFQSIDFPRTYDIDKRIKINSVYSKKQNKVINFISRFLKTGNLIRSFQPDIILTVYHVQDIPIWFYTRFTKTKIISTEHNSFERPSYAPMTRRDFFLKFYVNRLFDAVTVLTQADAEYIGKRLKKVFVLPNPLAFSPITTPTHRKKIIMAIGRLDVWFTKGFDLLIKAFAQISPYYPEWHLRIVGSTLDKGKAKKILQQMVDDQCIPEKIEFLNYRKDIIPLYQECELFVLDTEAWQRSINFINAFFSFSMDTIDSTDHSAAFRVSPFYAYLGTVDIMSKNFWLGAGIDSGKELCRAYMSYISADVTYETTTNVGGMMAFIYDYGIFFIISLGYAVYHILKSCQDKLIVSIWVATSMVESINMQMFWFSLTMLTFVTYFVKQPFIQIHPHETTNRLPRF